MFCMRHSDKLCGDTPPAGPPGLQLGRPGGVSGSLPPLVPVTPSHLHVGMSRRNGRMRTTASQSWHLVRHQGRQGPQARQGCQHCWSRAGPQCWLSQGSGPQVPHCQRCTWPCAEPACEQSPPPEPGCQPCSVLSTHPANTRPGGGPEASPCADLQMPQASEPCLPPPFPYHCSHMPGPRG